MCKILELYRQSDTYHGWNKRRRYKCLSVKASIVRVNIKAGAHSLVRVHLTFASLWKFSSLQAKWESKVTTKWFVFLAVTWQSLSSIAKWQSKLKWPPSDRQVTEQNFTNYSHARSELNFQSELKGRWTLTNECAPVLLSVVVSQFPFETKYIRPRTRMSSQSQQHVRAMGGGRRPTAHRPYDSRHRLKAQHVCMTSCKTASWKKCPRHLH